jgi:hypothetical protein
MSAEAKNELQDIGGSLPSSSGPPVTLVKKGSPTALYFEHHAALRQATQAGSGASAHENNIPLTLATPVNGQLLPSGLSIVQDRKNPPEGRGPYNVHDCSWMVHDLVVGP